MELALLEAATRGDTTNVARLLRLDATISDTVDENGCSALQRAAADGHIEVVTLLLTHGANPNKQDIVHGNTALHEASWKGYSRCVATLAAQKANLHIRNFGGFAPAHLACQNGHNQTCRELLLAGCDPDIHNNYGDTPLHTAARYGHAGVTRILISAECRVSEQNKNGDTALHIAAAMGRRKLTRILLEAGCDKNLRNMQNETARDIAIRKELSEIVDILDNIKVSKVKKRDRSMEKHDSTDGKVRKSIVKDKNDKTKKRPKTVHFESAQHWSPYGCHYYPDPKSFPKPRLDSLPREPLRKGEQYYLDLAGNIRKGPIGAGYTCYCAPFFKHMEDKLNQDKEELKQHIDEAHDRLDQKVNDLETKTAGQISELTRCVAAERFRCKERHLHLEHWLTRGMMFRQSERPRRLEYSPKGSVDIPPMKRTRSLEILDHETNQWNKVHNIIKNFNENEEQFTSDRLKSTKQTSRSVDVLDTVDSPTSSRDTRKSQGRTVAFSDRSPMRSDASVKSSGMNASSHTNESDKGGDMQNVTAEIHVKNNNVKVLHSFNDRTPSNYSKSPVSHQSDNRRSDSDGDLRRQQPPNVHWRSHVMTRTAEDIRNRTILEKELPHIIMKDQRRSCIDSLPQDGYIRIPKFSEENGDRKISVHEMVAKVEEQQTRTGRDMCQSPEPAPRNTTKPNLYNNSTNLLKENGKVMEQPSRPAPVLKASPQTKPTIKRFSLHNLIPFPTRKSFQLPPKKEEDNSESSEDEGTEVRNPSQPGPMRTGTLLQTSNGPYQSQQYTASTVQPPLRSHIPKDAYFHELPNRQTSLYQQHPYYVTNHITNMPQRSRNPVYNSEGLFDPTTQDRIPQHYSNQLDSNTEIEIANQPLANYIYGTDHEMLQNRLQTLNITTHITDLQAQMDRESHNDSGYSTKVYGSSQGPSPSFSGNVDLDNSVSAQRLNAILQSKNIPNTSHISASSLV